MFNQLKTKLEEDYKGIIPEITKLNPVFGNITDRLMKKLLRICVEDLMTVDFDNITAADFIDWYDVSGGMGNFILDFIDGLTLTDIVNLGKTDPRFIKAVKSVVTSDELSYATEEEIRDLPLEGDFRDSSNKITFPLLIKWLFGDAAENYSEGGKPRRDASFLAAMVDMVRETYESLTESLFEGEEVEGNIDDVKSEGDVFNIDVPEQAEYESPAVASPISDPTSQEVYSEEGEVRVRGAIRETLRGLTQEFWDIISSINSIMVTIEYDYKKEDSESIRQILSAITDDLTINLGMLNVAITTVDSKTPRLLDKGEREACKILKN